MTASKPTLSERKRAAIIAAATECFQVYGVQLSTMDKIAEVANVSKRTVYNHFPSKEQLVTSLLSQLWHQLANTVDIEYQSGQPLRPQLLKALRLSIDVLGDEEYVSLARVGVGHYLFQESDLPDEILEKLWQETYLQRWISAAISDNRLKDMKVESAGDHLYSMIKGSAHWPQVLKIKPILNSEQRKKLAHDIADLFLNSYGI